MKNLFIQLNYKRNNVKMNLKSEIDLYRIPIKTLKNSKLSDFNGPLIHQLLIEMIDDSENMNNNKYTTENNININPKNKSKNKIMNIYTKDNKEILHQINNNKSNLYSFDNDIKMNKSFSDNNSNKNKERFKIINGINQLKIEKIIFKIKYDTKMGEDLAVIGSINELGNWQTNRALKMGWNSGNIWKTELYLNDNNIFDFEYKFILTCGGYVKKWEDGNNRKFNLLQIKGLIEACRGEGTIIHLKNIEGKNIDFNYNNNTLIVFCWWNVK